MLPLLLNVDIMRMLKSFLSFLLLLLPLLLQGQVSFVVQAPSRVDPNEHFRLQFVLSNAESEEFTPPSIADFEILAGPSKSVRSEVQIVNGRSSSYSSEIYTFILLPKKKGTFRIGAASVRANGKLMRTQPVSITVAGGSAKGGSASAKAHVTADPFAEMQQAGSRISEKDLYFVAKLSKRRVYEQEPIMLTYHFYARQGLGLAHVESRQKPDFKGFWTQEVELPRNLKPAPERIGGALYLVGKNEQYLIFPQQTGKLTIPPLTFDCDVLQHDATIDAIDAFFNGAGTLNVKVQRTTQAQHIEVLPLPTPRPVGFSGGVGQFAMTGALVSAMPKTNDIGTYRIVVKGTGNLKLVKAPDLNFPKDFERYTPRTNDKTRITVDGVTGEMQFDYTFVPRNVGTYTIPAATLIYFDTSARRYVTLRTAPCVLKIEKGLRSEEQLRSELALRNSDIRPPHLGENRPFRSGGVSQVGSWRYFGALAVVLLLGIGGLRLLRHWVVRWSDGERRRSRKAGAKAHKRIRSAARLLQADRVAFYGALAEALTGYFSDKLSLPSSALTRQDIAAALAERGVAEPEVKALYALLEEIDFGRFAPSAETENHEGLFERADTLLRNIDSQLR